MKRIQLVIITFVSLTAATCGGERTLVKEAAYGYLDAMGNYRIAEARPYATPQTQTTTLDYIEHSIMPYVDQKSIEKNMPARITVKRVRLLNDTLARAYYRKVTPVKTQNDSITLVKREGEWKVSLLIKRSRTLDMMKKMAAGSKTKDSEQPEQQ